MSAPENLFDQICDLVADITGEDGIRDEPDIDLFEENVQSRSTGCDGAYQAVSP